MVHVKFKYGVVSIEVVEEGGERRLVGNIQMPSASGTCGCNMHKTSPHPLPPSPHSISPIVFQFYQAGYGGRLTLREPVDDRGVLDALDILHCGIPASKLARIARDMLR